LRTGAKYRRAGAVSENGLRNGLLETDRNFAATYRPEMTRAPVFVLVHSPLVGPGTWAPVAVELAKRGRKAVRPSLLGPSDWRECVQAVCDGVAALSEPFVLVSHSGSGLLLPAIADALAQQVSGMIFVDSGLPAAAGETRYMPPASLERFATLAVNGVLPPWSEWFGEEAMREVIPDERLRHALIREMPEISLAFLEQCIPSPAGWDRRPCSYLLLSEAYKPAAREARERGWPVEAIEGAQHLHIAVAPEAVVDALLRLEP
jgi:pimeloyl-ACP methyl ester carboxylesterase